MSSLRGGSAVSVGSVGSAVLVLAALAVSALADAGAGAPDAPAAQDDGVAGAALLYPYPYAQAQAQAHKDAQPQYQQQYQQQQYSAQLPYAQPQQLGYEGGYPGYYPGVADPAFALEAAGGTAVAVAVAVKALAWLASHVAALALGGVLALAACKLTPLCALVAHKWHSAELPSPEEVRAFTQPATEMLRAALHKYSHLNEKHR